MQENNAKYSTHDPRLWGFSLGLLIMLCVMYQAYFYGFSIERGINGPSWQRSFLKISGLLLFYLAILKVFTTEVFLRNFILKVPIVIFAIVTVLVSPFLGPFEIQAVNMCFFIPLLAIDFDKFRNDFLFHRFFKVFSLILFIQILLDPVLKVATGVHHGNMALIGGVGNANSFGYLLLCASIYCRLCIKRPIIFYFFCISSVFTGSLVILLAATFIAVLGVANDLGGLKIGNLGFLLFATIGLLILGIFLPEEILGKFFSAFYHAADKFLSLLLFVDGSQVNSASISVRKEWTLEGLRLISENPWSLLIGHPEGTALYAGDGWWLTLLVSHGLPLSILFLLCNGYAMFRGIKLRSSEGKCASLIIGLTCIIFLTNRILDYWPAAIVYLFAFAYVCNTRIKKVVMSA
tara:strand:+ start:1056 stop:2273 length:1218 start_codon:yes stop_codon:yes gene_type:complete